MDLDCRRQIGYTLTKENVLKVFLVELVIQTPKITPFGTLILFLEKVCRIKVGFDEISNPKKVTAEMSEGYEVASR